MPATQKPMNAAELFESTILTWLRKNYKKHKFFTERDVVWTVQTHIMKELKNNDLPYRVFNDHRIPSSRRRTDLAIPDKSSCSIEVAIEFKYEPSHSRKGKDIFEGKFPVVAWGKNGIATDMQRIRKYLADRTSKIAYLVFIDEGGCFQKRTPPCGSEWIDWEKVNPYSESEHVSLLWSKMPQANN